MSIVPHIYYLETLDVTTYANQRFYTDAAT